MNNFNIDLVINQDGKIVTTSRIVAEKFNKRHSDVIRSIENLDCSTDFNQRNFTLVEYLDKKGELRKEYTITRDGFSFLAMGFTGKKAAKFKEDYITAFNRMEAEMVEPKQLSTLEILELALKNEKEKLRLEGEVKRLEPKATMYDRVLNDDKLLKIGNVAKLFKMQGIGRNNMFKELRARKILFGREPYQQYIERGYFKVNLTTYTHPKTGEIVTDTITLVTKKGLNYLAKIFEIDIPEDRITEYIQ